MVLSGGYEDDEDHGEVIVYTGHGGNDPETGRQIADQALTQGNLALAVNCLTGLPVRVVRGAKLRSSFAPPVGYRYDGLYRVERYWQQTGRSGFKVWRFLLERGDLAPPPWPGFHPTPPLILGFETQLDDRVREAAGLYAPAYRREMRVQRVVRSTAVVQRVKQLHRCCCQVCGQQLCTPVGFYAEGAHIRPLGAGHNGPDSPDNVLCLCPNCHVQFDGGGFSVGHDLSILDLAQTGLTGQLRIHPQHSVGQEYLAYHRALFVP